MLNNSRLALWKSVSQANIFWWTCSCCFKVPCLIMQLYLFPSSSVNAQLLFQLWLLLSFYICQYKNNEASVLAAFAYFLLSNIKPNLHYQALHKKLPSNLLECAPTEIVGQATWSDSTKQELLKSSLHCRKIATATLVIHNQRIKEFCQEPKKQRKFAPINLNRTPNLIKLQVTFRNPFTYRILELKGAFEMSCLRS